METEIWYDKSLLILCHEMLYYVLYLSLSVKVNEIIFEYWEHIMVVDLLLVNLWENHKKYKLGVFLVIVLEFINNSHQERRKVKNKSHHEISTYFNSNLNI